MQTRREVYAHRTRVFKAISVFFAPDVRTVAFRRSMTWKMRNLSIQRANLALGGSFFFPLPAGPPVSMPSPAH